MSELYDPNWVRSQYVQDFEANGERVVLAKLADSKQHFRVYEVDGKWELRCSFGTILADGPLECVRKLTAELNGEKS
jgi:hypothetical protein